jgi:phospholipid transport system transporter-binding protein
MSGTSLIPDTPGIFRLEGPLTAYTVEPLLEVSWQAFSDHKTLQIDFRAVTTVDSSSMALLLAWMRYAHKQKIDLKFTHLPQPMIDLAHVSGLDSLLPIL